MADFNSNDGSIKIYNSKLKIVGILFISLVFVAGGCWFIWDPTASNTSTTPTTETLIIGYMSIIFFGICAIVAVLKFFDKRPGLLIDKSGITIYYRLAAKDTIEWGDIEKFGTMQIKRTQLITICLKNPEEYIDNQTSTFKKRALRFNLKMYNAPMSITTNSLKCSFDELYALLNNKLAAYNSHIKH